MRPLRWVPRGPAALACAVLGAWARPAFASCEDPEDPPRPGEDCDEDGWLVSDGDCDDEDDAVNPGEEETCVSPADDDCDGLFDEGCDRALQRGTLLGGSACATGPAPHGVSVPGALATWLLVRRRRRC